MVGADLCSPRDKTIPADWFSEFVFGLNGPKWGRNLEPMAKWLQVFFFAMKNFWMFWLVLNLPHTVGK